MPRLSDLYQDEAASGFIPAAPPSAFVAPVRGAIRLQEMMQGRPTCYAGGTPVSLADMVQIPKSKAELGLSLAAMLPVGKVAKGVKRYYHGSKAQFEKFDLSKASPYNEHGPAIYITDSADEAAKYGSVRDVEFSGQAFKDDAPFNRSFMNNFSSRLLERVPEAREKIVQAAERINAGRKQLKNGYTNGLALQELRRELPGDFVRQSNTVNEVLREMGYGAREYTEEGGARSLAVFDLNALR